MSHVCDEFERATLTAAQMCEQMAPVQAEWQRVANDAQCMDSSKTRPLGKAMANLWPALWSFVECENVVPTNNDEERAVRKVLKLRKVTFGSTSGHGAEQVARFRTILGAAKRQRVALMDWLARRRQTTLDPVTGAPLLQPA